MKERLKYFILALFLGMICKIYDDLVDNNLYKNFNISNKNKPYVDDILKGFFIIGFSIISIEYPLLYILFLITNLLTFILIDEVSFSNSYEFSCFISPLLLFPFLKWSNINEYTKDIFWSSLIISAGILIIGYDNKIIDENKEYNNKKMYTRLLNLIILICLMLNRSFVYISLDLLPYIIFSIGYLFISCISQYCLINNIWKNGNSNDTKIKNKKKK